MTHIDYNALTDAELWDRLTQNLASDKDRFLDSCHTLHTLESRGIDFSDFISLYPALRHYKDVAEKRLSPRVALMYPTASIHSDRALTALMNVSVGKQDELIDGAEVDFFYFDSNGKDASHKVTFHRLRLADYAQVLGPKGIRSLLDQKMHVSKKPPRINNRNTDPARGIDPNKKATIRADAAQNRLQVGDVYVTVDDLAPHLAELSHSEIARMQTAIMAMAFARV